ncbi:MAG: LamG-like jellyroll fold domain-containing protein [Bacteroidia bacterium]
MKSKLTLIFFLLISLNSYSQLSSNALYFDGVDDVVSIQGGYAIGINDVTFEAWIKDERPVSSFSLADLVFSISDTPNVGMSVYLHEGKISTVFAGISCSQQEVDLGPDLRDNLCHHIAVTRSGGTLTVYVDGIQVGQETTLVCDIPYNFIASIGGDLALPGFYQFMGLIKEVRFWNVARTQSQIQSNMNVVLNPAVNPNLKGYWRLNEGTGQHVTDYAFGNNGLLGNYFFAESIDPAWAQGCPACVPPASYITAVGSTTFCTGGSVKLKAPVAANKKYQWIKGITNITGETSSTYIATTGGTYKVNVTDSITGCSKLSPGKVVKVNPLPNATITPQGATTFCNGDSVILKGNFISGAAYQWKKGTNAIAGATKKNYTAKSAGNYKIIITDTNGCSKASAQTKVTVPCKTDGSIFETENLTDLKIYPNPSSGDFNIELIDADENAISTEVFYVTGERVTANITQVSNSDDGISFIQIKNLHEGIYFVKIVSGPNQYYRKIVKTN